MRAAQYLRENKPSLEKVSDILNAMDSLSRLNQIRVRDELKMMKIKASSQGYFSIDFNDIDELIKKLENED